MRASEIREMTRQERRALLDELVEEYRRMRFGHVMQQLPSPAQLRGVRRDIARVRTILRQEESRTAGSETASGPEGETA